MIIDPDESGDGVPGGNESVPGNSDDDDDNTIDTDGYLDDDGGTGGYGSIGDDDGLDLGNFESGIPGRSDPANDATSSDPNEDSDGDEVVINPDGSVSTDEDRLSGSYESAEDVAGEIRSIIGGRSSEVLRVGKITVLEEQLRNPRESLTGMDESTGDSSSGGFPAAGAAGVAVVIAIGAAVLAGGDDK